MRTIGIDLSITESHKAIIADEEGNIISPILRIESSPESMDRLLERAQEGNKDGQIQVVMEPTGMAWMAVAVYLIRCGVRVYLVNSQQVADLRRFYKKHAKSDRIDCRVMVKLPKINKENLHELKLSGGIGQACQRGCKQLERLQKQATASKNRLIDIDRFAWPGLKHNIFGGAFTKRARWFRKNWYNPHRVMQIGVEGIRRKWIEENPQEKDDREWLEELVKLAQQAVAIYGKDGEYLEYKYLEDEAQREQKHLEFLEEQHHQIQIKIVRPLYRKLHPSRNLETIPGVGQDGACVFASFIGQPERFHSIREYRGWSGMVPNSRQSADSQGKGLKITQAGPRLIKKFSYLDADTARKIDPQIAALYYDQMVKKGKHHTQAVCACASHLLDRVLVVFREDRPYEIQDVDGKLITKQQGKAIVEERYQVPEEIRRRNKKRTRREQADRHAEKKVRESYAGSKPQLSQQRL